MYFHHDYLFLMEKEFIFYILIFYNPNLDEYNESNQQLQTFHCIINDQICVKIDLLLVP